MLIEIISLLLIVYRLLSKSKRSFSWIPQQIGDPVHVAFGMWLGKLAQLSYSSSSIPLAIIVLIFAILYIVYQLIEDYDIGTRSAYKDILTFTASFAVTLGVLIGIPIGVKLL